MAVEARNYHCRICNADGFTSAGAVFRHQRAAHPDNPKVKRALRSFKHRKPNGKAVVKRSNGNGALAHPSTEDHSDVVADEYFSFPLGYAVGRTQAQLEAYAAGIGVPPASFTSRVARLLQRAARGQVLGSPNHLSEVPRRAAP